LQDIRRGDLPSATIGVVATALATLSARSRTTIVITTIVITTPTTVVSFAVATIATLALAVAPPSAIPSAPPKLTVFTALPPSAPCSGHALRPPPCAAIRHIWTASFSRAASFTEGAAPLVGHP